MATDRTQVLIVGAGPTGLVLAIFLTKLGVPVRIIDKADRPGTTSRAIVVHARTLEFYRQLGMADAAIRGGQPFHALNLWVQGKRVSRVAFGELGVGLSPFPYLLIFPQDEHEKMLIEQLGRLGVNVERQTELTSCQALGGQVQARLQRADGTVQTCEVPYVAGCDGAHSKVREELGIDFAGGTYAGLFYVADVEGTGPVVDGEMHGALDDTDFLAVFPLKTGRSVRLVGQARPAGGGAGATSWERVGKNLLERLRLRVDRVNWFSTYGVHHRIAASFRRGAVFLLGDAAHIHSPVGGQGMNTGVGDAVNLAWKLAAVLRGRLDPGALDTFETERIAFARTLVETTDQAFLLLTKRGPIARRVRLRVAPFLLPKLFRLDAVRRFMFRKVSQISIRYPESRLSSGSAGKVAGGDRLPWIDGGPNGNGRNDNFAGLTSLDWQVHGYGEMPRDVRSLCDKESLTLHVFPWRPVMKARGLLPNAVYLIRPDGYVGWVDPAGDAAKLGRYLEEHRIRSAAALEQ